MNIKEQIEKALNGGNPVRDITFPGTFTELAKQLDESGYGKRSNMMVQGVNWGTVYGWNENNEVTWQLFIRWRSDNGCD